MWGKRIAYSIIAVLIIAITVVSVYLGIILFGNYAIDEKDLVMKESTTVVDTEGQEITRLFSENRETVSIDQIPSHVQEAFIAVEDQRFYDHTGIDPRSILRALYRDIIARSASEGGSTITQQLAKNVFLSPEKSLLRKTEEVLIALNLEHRYSKEEILEMYMNRIYFGHGAHGVQAASQLYFGKSIEELDVEEGALLASLPKGPNLYSPFIDEDKSKSRRDLVLSLMHQQGYLEAEETVRLQGRTIPQDQHSITSDPAYDTYVDMLIEEMENVYHISEEEVLSGGYRIVAPIDTSLQLKSYETLHAEDAYPIEGMEGSLVLLDNETGGVKAVQGGRNYARKGFNYADAPSQPGSVMKPLAVFAPAMEAGEYEPYSLLKDEQLSYDGYEPQNLNGTYEGEVTMYDALLHSVNAPAVWLLNELGIDEAKEILEKQNILIEDEGLSIALGGLEKGISPMQTAAAYRTFANEGRYSTPYFVEEIYDRHGELIEQVEIEEIEVVSPQTAWNMTRMLEAVVTEGTGTAGSFDGALAGKTGTSTGARDIWFAGWTPEVSGAVWMGAGEANEQLSSSTPTALFKNVISSEEGQDLAFSPPEGVNDLEEPIRLAELNNLEADMNLGLLGGNVELRWEAVDEERLHYRIYKLNDGERELLDEVVGESSYTVSRQNIFASHEFIVVPYNPQTKREGTPSERVEADWSIFSWNAS
ncbi:transglycosylase domain-containing protein [Alkalicoccus daliensis]|uniref:Penicillin-binding protein 2A n=1 Tax=Alkalicoccus daliensis TaxID=745820 RepID=A0A1H0IG92_9BACI|nr:PBP1A family penicillin-binding protein [Alkalicoccus daliensis]SDO30413.1 penicillin-binding protein 2A [Alkalicoccus daliensis]